MDVFERWREFGANLRVRIVEQIRLAVEENKDIIIALNQKQLGQGEDKTGNRLPPYSKHHAQKRTKAGLQTTVKDLKFGGEFRDNIYVIPFDNFYEMGSRDFKAGFLEDNTRILGSSAKLIFGLNDENRDLFFRQYIKPKLQKWFKMAE